MSEPRIDPSARIHPTAVLEGEVVIGPETVVGAMCYLRGPLVIGARNRINPMVIIGTESEHKTRAPQGTIYIGDDNVITERVTINRGTGDRETTIGSRCFIMDHVHVSHDVVIGDDVTIAHNVVFGGHTHVLSNANIGMGALTHQHSTIGSYAMIGMGAVITRDVPPFALVAGNPARFRRWNTHAMKGIPLGEDALRIENGALVSEHAFVKECLAAFAGHVRRKVLPLTRERSAT